MKRLHSGTTSDKLILKFYEKLVIWVSYFIFGIFTSSIIDFHLQVFHIDTKMFQKNKQTHISPWYHNILKSNQNLSELL